MKNKIISILFMTAVMSSCSFLDVVPENTATLQDSFASEMQAERFLYSIYNFIPNNTTHRWTPDLCAGGDLITGSNGTTRWFPYKSMLYGEENPNNTYFNMWGGGSIPQGGNNFQLYKGIRFAYMLLNNVDSVPDMTQSAKDQMKGEAYFLIAYLHWTLMQYYGPVVLITHEISLNADESELMLPRSTWDECAKFVAETFDKAASMLPPRVNSSNDLGRATSVAAKAYKARCLVYTASPLVNGNSAYASFVNYDGTPLMSSEYDREKWNTAMKAVEEAIRLAEDNGYRLYEYAEAAGESDAERGRQNYYQCFVDEDWASNPEYIFAIGAQTPSNNAMQMIAPPRQWNPEEGDGYTADGFREYMNPTLQIVEAFLTDKGLPLWADPRTKDGYAANRLLTADSDEVAQLCKNRDPRFYATIGYDRGTYTYNGQEDLVLRMRAGEQHGDTGDVTQEYSGSCTGFILQKFISKNTTYNEADKTFSFAQYPFPYLRLAELYLDYAEADFEYDGQLGAQGLEYLNKVRHRAGLPDFEDAWAEAGGMPSEEDMRRALHQENMSELACEGRLYHNLRRWNIAQDWLGEVPDVLNIKGESPAEYNSIAKMRESGTRVFEYPKTVWLAIPLSELEVNFRLVQNPGY